MVTLNLITSNRHQDPIALPFYLQWSGEVVLDAWTHSF